MSKTLERLDGEKRVRVFVGRSLAFLVCPDAWKTMKESEAAAFHEKETRIALASALCHSNALDAVTLPKLREMLDECGVPYSDANVGDRVSHLGMTGVDLRIDWVVIAGFIYLVHFPDRICFGTRHPQGPCKVERNRRNETCIYKRFGMPTLARAAGPTPCTRVASWSARRSRTRGCRVGWS